MSPDTEKLDGRYAPPCCDVYDVQEEAVCQVASEQFAVRLRDLLAEMERAGLHPQDAAMTLVDNAVAAIDAIRWTHGGLKEAKLALESAAERLAL